MDPVLIKLGPLAIRWYGVMIATACLVGLWVAGREADRKGIGKKAIQEFWFYAIIGAIIGARLYYVAFFDPASIWHNPISLFAIWEGGLAIHGGILGGLLISIWYTRRRRLSFWRFADTMAPSLILGQAIGRIGCFFNGDAHGYPTTLPWGVRYSLESPAGQMFPGQPLHPAQLYEMAFNFIIFLILWKVRKNIKVDGYLFLLYVILYSSIRIFVEHFRADRLTYFGSFSAAQSMGFLGIIVGFFLMVVIRKKKYKAT